MKESSHQSGVAYPGELRPQRECKTEPSTTARPEVTRSPAQRRGPWWFAGFCNWPPNPISEHSHRPKDALNFKNYLQLLIPNKHFDRNKSFGLSEIEGFFVLFCF